MNNSEFAETVRQYLYATGAPSSRPPSKGEAMSIESTGHKPTDRERSLACLTVAVDRIQRELDAMRLAVEELKQPQQGSLT